MFDGETETELNPGMQERAREAGIVMRRPQWSPNTIMAHEATMFAKEHGLDGEFHHVVAAAYWENSADLGNIEVLEALAVSCGLDWKTLQPRLESGHYRQRVLDENQSARERGISGTPTYGVAGETHWGDLSVQQLRELIEAAS